MTLLQYLIAGASLVAIGTGALRDPELPERIVGDLDCSWCASTPIATFARSRR